MKFMLMLIIWSSNKTQLICFQLRGGSAGYPLFTFCGTSLQYSVSVSHLGHIVHFNLDDTEDINRAIKDLCRKSNHLLITFSSCDPLVKTFLLNAHCFNSYGCALWRLDCKSLKAFEVACIMQGLEIAPTLSYIYSPLCCKTA